MECSRNPLPPQQCGLRNQVDWTRRIVTEKPQSWGRRRNGVGERKEGSKKGQTPLSAQQFDTHKLLRTAILFLEPRGRDQFALGTTSRQWRIGVVTGASLDLSLGQVRNTARQVRADYGIPRDNTEA